MTIIDWNEAKTMLQGWLDSTSDLELREMLAPSLKTEDEWRVVAAIGTYERLRSRSKEETQAFTKTLLEGKCPSEEMMASYLWARSLSTEQCHFLQDMLMAQLDILYSDLQFLEETSGENWNSYYLQWLIQRDEAESVRVILHMRDDHDNIESLLANFDEDAMTFASRHASVHTNCIKDERLRRAHSLDPDAWWCREVEALPTTEKSCPNCNEPFTNHRPFVVVSFGPREWGVAFFHLCDRCWSMSVRGDGHCYSGAFSNREEAEAHAAFLSR